MLMLTHYNDHKKDSQSHRIQFQETDPGRCYDITQCAAYGDTKEEALRNLEEIIYHLLDEYEAIEKLYCAGFYEDDLREVDCFGKLLKAENNIK